MSKSRRKAKKADNERHVEELSRYLERKGPGDEWHAPTPERVARAKEAGSPIRPNITLTEKGNPTGHFTWKITPVVDELHKRGTIADEEWAAAVRYMRYYAGSRHKGPATSKFLPAYDKGFQGLEPGERAMAMGQSRAVAEKAVHPFFRPCLRWLEAAAEDEWPLWRLGEMYYPNVSQAQQSARAPVILHFCLSMLAEHFGVSRHRFSVSDVEMVIRTMRVTIEVKDTILKTA
jgi:hypothetical protein